MICNDSHKRTCSKDPLTLSTQEHAAMTTTQPENISLLSFYCLPLMYESIMAMMSNNPDFGHQIMIVPVCDQQMR